VYPALSPYYSDFEKSYDPTPVLQLMKDMNYSVPFVSVLLYLIFCHFGGKIMEKQKPFGLLSTLAVWNLFLSLFSFYGAVRTVPHMLHRILNLPFEQTVCEAPHTAYGAGACGLAVQLFIISKIPELIDTVFIVLRKKPLIFLHWYHHVTVLLYCWNAYVTESAAGKSLIFPASIS
jgi:elongation of very long chain fatty acids protein 6